MQIEAVATKEELEHLASLCRSEIDSMGRIAAGMLRLLKLDKSLGQGAMDQLTNLGKNSTTSFSFILQVFCGLFIAGTF